MDITKVLLGYPEHLLTIIGGVYKNNILIHINIGSGQEMVLVQSFVGGGRYSACSR